MEIFQTIWTAITTPNEGLITILGIPLTILEALINMLFFTTIFDMQSNKKTKLIYVITYSLIAYTINAFIPRNYGIFINVTIWFFLIYFMFKTTIIKSILAETTTLVVTSILDTILINSILNIFDITLEQILIIPILRISTLLLIYLIMWVLTILIKYFKLNINVFDNMNKKTKIYIALNSVLMIIILSTQFYLVSFYSDSMPILITIISIMRNYSLLLH